MTKVGSFTVTYDQRADVLYLGLSRNRAKRGIEDDNGIVWRYDENGTLLGVTVMDFADCWVNHKCALADAISLKAHIVSTEIKAAIAAVDTAA